MPKKNGYSQIKVSRDKLRSPDTQRRKRVKRRKITVFYLLVVLLIAAVGAFICANYLFEVKYVEVTGVSKYTPEDIVVTSGIQAGDKLFGIDKREIESEIKDKYPYVEKVEIKRKYPDTVRIVITQRKPAVCYETERGYTLIDINGNILEEELVREPYGITIVKGLKERPVKPVAPETSDKEERQKYLEAKLKYEEELEEYEEILATMKSVVNAVKKAELQKVSYVDIANRQDIQIICSGRITVAIGNESQIDYKLTMSKKIMDEYLTDYQKYYVNAKNPGTVSYRVIKDSEIEENQ